MSRFTSMRYPSTLDREISARTLVWFALVGSSAAWATEPTSEHESAPQAPFWSFRTPVRPALPAVNAEAWVRQPLDRFVLARLEAEQLPPSEQADRITLIRRLSFDLIGLPPTPAEVDAFCHDTGENAIEQLVDRLLASPHFGEQMAIRWLDLARYADTNGYDFDTARQMHAWRDWVIAAFDRNLPFDQFAREQLAGDLLPNATLEQRIATGFLRNHPTALIAEGQPGEYRDKYVVDRVNTIGTAFLGLTIGCAQCHDHKFDPISQSDFYRLYAVVNDFGDEGLRGRAPGNPVPFVHLPKEPQAAELAEVDAKIASLRSLEAAAERDGVRELREFVANARKSPHTDSPIVPTFQYTLDGDEPGVTLGGIGRVDPVDGVAASRSNRALHFDGKDGSATCGTDGRFTAEEPFAIAALIRLDKSGAGGIRTIVARSNIGALRDRGYVLDIQNGKVRFALISDSSDDARIEALAAGPLDTDRWVHLCATYDGSRARQGLALYLDGAPLELTQPEPDADPAPHERLEGPIDGVAPLQIGLSDGAPFWGSIDDVRIYSRALTANDVADMVRAEGRAIARLESPSIDATLWLSDWFSSRESTTVAPLVARRRAAEERKRKLLQKVDVASVAMRAEAPPVTHLLVRGDYTNPGPVVTGAAPHALTPGGEVTLADRQALAQWITAPENPLFARVAVNRLFAQFLGRGLVTTTDDFGARGAAPTHPELLDWLACEFRDSKYDVKALVRSLVTSATYLQSSRCSPTLRESDPENLLLARADRRRLPAENVLDNALAIGGVLDLTIGGKAQPIWRPKARKDDKSAAIEGTANAPRRGLYAKVVRAAPDPILALFDAPPREVCVASRTPTTTPLQSLVTWNDAAFLGAARGLAARMRGASTADDERLIAGFRLCVARAPAVSELQALRAILQQGRDEFAANEGAATELLAASPPSDPLDTTELAAFTSVAQVLLNLDETMTRE